MVNITWTKQNVKLNKINKHQNNFIDTFELYSTIVVIPMHWKRYNTYKQVISMYEM